MDLKYVFLIYLLVGVFGSAIGDSQEAKGHVTQVTSTSPDGQSTSTSTTSVSGSGDSSNADLSATIAKALEANPQLASLAATYLGTGSRASRQSGAYNYPPPPPPTTGGPGPVGGFPFLPFGFGKGFHLNVDGGAGFGGLGGYYPVIEKVIVIVGGAILILLILAMLQGAMSKGGLLHSLGGGFSKALAGSAAFDLGPIHKSVAGAASVNLDDGIHIGGQNPHDPHFNNRVNNAFNQRF